MALVQLTRLSHLGFQLHHYGFWYMPRSPVAWNPNLKRLEYTSSKTALKTFAISMFLNILASLGCMYNIATHLFVKPKLDYSTSILVLHIFAIFACSAVPIAVILLLQNNNFLQAYNRLINLLQNLPRSDSFSEIHQAFDQKPIFLVVISGILFIFLSTITPFAILVCSLYFRFDPYYFVIQDIIGRNNDLAVSTKYICIIFRFFVVLAGFEVNRFLSLLIYCNSIVIVRICIFVGNISQIKLTANTKRSYKIISWYTKFLVCFREIQELVAQLNSLFISFGYWVVVVLTWGIVRLRGLMVGEIFALIIGFDICNFLLLIIVVVIVSRLDASINKVIIRWGNESDLNYCCQFEKQNDLVILQKITASLQPLQIEYKPFFVVNKEFGRDVCKNLVGRVFDVILIFEV